MRRPVKIADHRAMTHPVPDPSDAFPRIAMIAGELSGDLLGAAFTRALRARFPKAHVYGVAGPQMVAAGCEAIESIEQLSVMGLAEVLPAIPRLLALRRRLVGRLAAERPDLVIGLDAPDFNLGLERRLRQRGLRTLHVVSPSIWAWRPGRVHRIVRSTQSLLCLLPFEPACYDGHPIRARYIGHPLADELDDRVTPEAARRTLGLDAAAPCVAILPGSRGSELKYLAEPFARAAARLHARRPGLRFITPVAKPALEARLRQAIADHAPQCDWTVLSGQSRLAMQAADAVLLASGTATLECLLLGRPMVVAYRGSPLTAWLMLEMGLLRTAHVSLPNLLSATPCVSELLQDRASPENLAAELEKLLDGGAVREQQLRNFDEVRRTLRCQAAERAVDEIEAVLAQPAA